jgi:hypothetical protein
VEFAERAARNEQVFRSVNDHIDKAADRHGRDVPGTYERVAATRYRFIVLQGHEVREIERIIERHEGWLVVEKFGDARQELDRARSA